MSVVTVAQALSTAAAPPHALPFTAARAPDAALPQAVGQLLDALGQGVALVNEGLLPRYLNRAARLWLGAAAWPADTPVGQALDASQRWQLRAAVKRAGKGEWSMLVLGPAQHRRPVGVVPLTPSDAWPDAVAMLVLGAGAGADGLALRLFSRLHRLTPTESQVLAALVDGLTPAQIAQQAGVAVCTVRTQLGAIRAKTQAASLRHLMQQVSGLPPLMGAALTQAG